MDQYMLVIDHIKKVIQCIMIDASTSERSDRMKGKAVQGLDQALLAPKIEEQLFKKFPEYVDYEVLFDKNETDLFKIITVYMLKPLLNIC